MPPAPQPGLCFRRSNVLLLRGTAGVLSVWPGGPPRGAPGRRHVHHGLNFADEILPTCGGAGGLHGAPSRRTATKSLGGPTPGHLLPKRRSCRMLCGTICRVRPGEVGAGARRAGETLLQLRCERRRAEALVDLGVYHGGRCFRLLHSSKKAAGIPLRPLRHSTGTLPAHVGPKEYLLSDASFVGPVDTFVVPSPPQPGAAALALLVPAVPRALPARPPSSTLRNNALELFLRGVWGEVDKRWRAGARPFHEEEAHAAGLRAVQEGGVQDSCLQGLRPLPGGFVWELSLGRLYCGCRGRAHRNNRVKIHVNPGEQRAWQMCYNPDCRLYRGESFSVPGSFCRGF